MIKKIMRLIIILIFIIHPMSMIKSSNLLAFSCELHSKSIEDKINNKYDEYLKNLHNYDSLKSYNKENVDFILKIEDYAMKSKSLPSISIAQAILETGYGKSKKLKYNIFGIKGDGIKTKTKEYYNKKFVTITSEFQRFNDYSEAFDRHYEIISRNDFKNRNYIDWANKIKKGGYATDPYYVNKLIYIIKKHQLYRLDEIQELQRKKFKLDVKFLNY